MNAMSANEQQDPHGLFEDVCRALTETRGGKGVGKAIKRVLGNDTDGTTLIGITHEGHIKRMDNLALE